MKLPEILNQVFDMQWKCMRQGLELSFQFGRPGMGESVGVQGTEITMIIVPPNVTLEPES